MHELITSVASVIILSLFVLQFAFSENLYLELSACEKVINEYETAGDHGPDDLMKLKSDLDRIPNVRAVIREDRVELTIENIVVPVWNRGSNEIRLTKELDHEESDHNTGDGASHEPSSEGAD